MTYATIVALAVFRCASISTLRSVEYFATGSDKLQTQRTAQNACWVDEDPDNYNSCVELGCSEITTVDAPVRSGLSD